MTNSNTPDHDEVRLQKFIADCGVTSRRKAEELIAQGRVEVNGVVVSKLGTKVTPQKDVVSVDGQAYNLDQVQKVYVVLHKPRGYITSMSDPQGRKTVMDLCQVFSERIYPVGRLDYLSEGLLILTNDGQVANMLMHPRYNVVKVYEVKVFGAINDQILKRLRKGVQLDEGFVKPMSVRVIKSLPTKTWLEFRLAEGRNREIRKLCDNSGITIDKLKRVAIGGLSIDGIAPAKYRILSKKQLLKAVGLQGSGAAIQNPKEYFSNKKTINIKKQKPRPQATVADDKTFFKFRKDTYFETLEAIKLTKENKAKIQKQKRKQARN
ncbi:MAG: rRNA pseudouridine synthase [Bacteriovoracaceae bacterium]|nr:rRNA pseudouridine synthase [Bacteriovoracaceae bacterium]